MTASTTWKQLKCAVCVALFNKYPPSILMRKGCYWTRIIFSQACV
jgi:hypothetical protein